MILCLTGFFSERAGIGEIDAETLTRIECLILGFTGFSGERAGIRVDIIINAFTFICIEFLFFSLAGFFCQTACFLFVFIAPDKVA